MGIPGPESGINHPLHCWSRLRRPLEAQNTHVIQPNLVILDESGKSDDSWSFLTKVAKVAILTILDDSEQSGSYSHWDPPVLTRSSPSFTVSVVSRGWNSCSKWRKGRFLVRLHRLLRKVVKNGQNRSFQANHYARAKNECRM